MRYTDERFAAVDRDMSSWLVTWLHPDGTRFYLERYQDVLIMTESIREAERFRYFDDAERAAEGRGPAWSPISVPEGMNA